MSNYQEQMWVHKEFKKRIKMIAATNGKSILKFTEELAGTELDKMKEEFEIKPIKKAKDNHGFPF